MPSPTDHKGYIGKVLHGCTTAFLPLHKSIKSCAKILWCAHHVTLVTWFAQSDHFRPFFCPALKSLTNYSAAMKSTIRKIIYRCKSITIVLIDWCEFFSILRLNGQSLALRISEKFKFWPNSKTNVVPTCSKVQLSLTCLKVHFFL